MSCGNLSHHPTVKMLIHVPIVSNGLLLTGGGSVIVTITKRCLEKRHFKTPVLSNFLSPLRNLKTTGATNVRVLEPQSLRSKNEVK